MVIAVRHELRVTLPNSALVVLSPDQRMPAVNEMRLEVRYSPVSITVKGQFDLWERDTDDSDSDTEDEGEVCSDCGYPNTGYCYCTRPV